MSILKPDFTITPAAEEVTIGTGAPVSAPVTGEEVYYNQSTGEKYLAIGGAWVLQPTAPDEVVMGAGAPISAPVAGNEIYINTLTGQYYLNVSGAWAGAYPTGGNVSAIPTPRIKLVNGDVNTGLSISGVMDSTQYFKLVLNDLPDSLLDPVLDLRLEMRHYRKHSSGRNNRTIGVSYERGSGWVLASHFVGGVSDADDRGSRGGTHSPWKDSIGNGGTVDRPCRWNLSSLGYGGVLHVPVAEAIAPWFRVQYVGDNNLNHSAWVAMDGRRGTTGMPNNAVRKVTRATNTLKVAFRYSVKTSSGQRVTSSETPPIFVGPKRALYIHDKSVRTHEFIMNPLSEYTNGGNNRLLARWAKQATAI